MANIKAKSYDGRITIRFKTQRGEIVSGSDLDKFARMNLRGFFRPKLITKNLVEYYGPASILLRQRMQKPITDYDFFLIIEQIVDATRKLQRNSIPWDRVIWKTDSSFINETTKELLLLYLPIEGVRTKSNILGFIEDIIYSAVPADPNSNKISDFVYFLRSLKNYDFERIESFISNVEKRAVTTINKSGAGRSGFITDKPQEYYEHYKDRPVNQDAETGLLEEEPETGLLSDQEGSRRSSPFYDEHRFSSSIDDSATGLLTEEEPQNGDSYSWGSNLETGLLDEDVTTGTWYDSDDGQTSILIEGQKSYPTLLRVKTGETISINKPVFRLGKERSYVDYFVSNNNAVSRSHADIITRGKKFFIKDLNSTNRTFINGKPIPANCEMEIINNDQIKLGNEEFIFHS